MNPIDEATVTNSALLNEYKMLQVRILYLYFKNNCFQIIYFLVVQFLVSES